jgi:hypothetical protein
VRLATALGALALGAGGFTVTTLPRPAFPGPAAAPSGPHRLVVVTSRYDAPGNLENDSNVIQQDGLPTLRGLQLAATIAQPATLIGLYGLDLGSARIMVVKRSTEQIGIDFKNYVWPPRIKPGDREFVYEDLQWAQYSRGVLYVENAHLTYARSSYGQNAYVTAIDLKTRRALWRSSALVANARTFLVTPHYLITGYGFTDEPNYLYLLDRATGRVVDRLFLPNGPERITWQGKLIHVRTYDHDVLVRLVGA